MTADPRPSFQMPPEAAAAVKAGNLIEAIKVVRQETGLGLKEAKDFVEAHIHSPRQVAPTRPSSPHGFPLEAHLELRHGNKIDAIKIVRAKQGLGLKEAKDAVEAYIAMHPDMPPSVRQSSGQRLIVVALLVFLIAMAAGVGAVLWLV
jgi:ribosomal protein L7/L12